MVRIKIAETSDREPWLSFRMQLFPATPRDQHERLIERIVDSQDKVAFIAMVDDRPVGLAECSLRPIAEGCNGGPVAYFEGWYVDEEYRRQGVGRVLFKTLCDWARQQGCTEMASDCDVTNGVSQKAHAAVGFTEDSQLVHFCMRL